MQTKDDIRKKKAASLFAEALRYDNGDDGDQIKALKLYREAMSFGSVAALNNIGVMYARGEAGLPKNPVRARELYLKAAEGGNAQGALNLYRCMKIGQGGSIDKKDALHWLKVAAERKNVEACRILGDFYERGCEGLPQDMSAAFATYLRGYEAKDSLCAYKYGCIELHKLPRSQDTHVQKMVVKSAIVALEYAAKAGNVDAMMELADLYNKGTFVEVDKPRSFNWRLMAAKYGNTKAQEQVALAYEVGCGVEKDLKLRNLWLAKAAEGGNMNAQFTIGSEALESKGDTGVAMSWLNKAADQGHHMAKMLMAERKLKDEHAAVQHLKDRAQRGDSMAQYQLALRCINGDGIRQSRSRAVQLFEASARAGNRDAMAELGWCYLNGVGVPCASDKKAYRCFVSSVGTDWPLSAKLSVRGVKGIRKCLVEGRGVKADKLKAKMAELWLIRNG